MKKTFPLHVEDRHPDRVMDALKHEIRKYVKRERRRALPAGSDYWDFDCRFGTQQDSAAPAHLAELNGLLDQAVRQGASAVYIEILARPAQRGLAGRATDVAESASGA